MEVSINALHFCRTAKYATVTRYVTLSKRVAERLSTQTPLADACNLLDTFGLGLGSADSRHSTNTSIEEGTYAIKQSDEIRTGAVNPRGRAAAAPAPRPSEQRAPCATAG
eukprot:2823327-Prymnesium_polylepis.2